QAPSPKHETSQELWAEQPRLHERRSSLPLVPLQFNVARVAPFAFSVHGPSASQLMVQVAPSLQVVMQLSLSLHERSPHMHPHPPHTFEQFLFSHLGSSTQVAACAPQAVAPAPSVVELASSFVDPLEALFPSVPPSFPLAN